MIAIVGLGNPGPKYDATRHNVGFWAIDGLAKTLQVSVTKSKFQSLVAECRVDGESVLLVKPQTFMNLSGLAVAEVVNFYKLRPEDDVIVVYDDMDFRPGQLKLRAQGSAGGHNGIKSIIAQLGTEAFCRVRVGIGRPAPGLDVIGHVLGKFPKEELQKVEKAVEAAQEALMVSVKKGFAHAMNQFNQVSFS
ncbi:aminoacyl-tRNA hydrolase [Alicyclobacillus dauci]|uniref:Peptidyl-tRNA hydrolase n=1 Tax=Alicyclobacillus dauci TaxID=1475485 RepID=A0ABY6Z3J9_9BACL|nr:aminoacyl-tRNA hydrolase [Alicyclobacillus dauci]WAH37330.1 aminoacyl-tRNA hydrolase [Alicyclobacillus dauci]